jgi:hypothetical protein
MTNVFNMVYKTIPPQRGITCTKNDPKKNDYYFAANEILILSVICSIAISLYMVHLLLQITSGCHMKNCNVYVYVYARVRVSVCRLKKY